MGKSKTTRAKVSILGFGPPMKPPTAKEQERLAAEHLVETKTRNHPHVKQIRDQIMREVLKAGRTVKATRG